MKNEHLIPINVIDIVEKLNKEGVRENEKLNYLMRLEAIKDYCIQAINKVNNQKNNHFNTRRSK